MRHPHWHLNTITALLTTICAMPAYAQEIELLPEITIYADRGEKKASELPNSITVVNEDDIEKMQAKNIKDLEKLDVNLSVRRNPTRFSSAFYGTGRDGNVGFNIRGLEGNRVLTTIDGIRMMPANSYGGHVYRFGVGDFVDMSTLKSVEVLSGSSSTLHGSDGLAGAVGYTTLSPQDLLGVFGQDTYGSIESSYAYEDKSWANTARSAVRIGNVELMGIITTRDGKEVKNKGNIGGVGMTRTAANPQDNKTRVGLLKATWLMNPNNQWIFTLEGNRRTARTDLLHMVSSPATSPTSVLSSIATDKINRDRVSIAHSYQSDSPWLKNLDWQLYYQKTKQNQFTADDRVGTDRTRDNTYSSQDFGASATATAELSTLGATHRLKYGFDVTTARFKLVRNGTVPPFGETYPNDLFPQTRYTIGGIFAQDEINVLNNRLQLTPGVRIDFYSLSPEASATQNTQKLTDQHVSPRLGMMYKLNNTWNLVANYAHGYKAPDPNQVNTFLSHGAQGTVIPSPNLKPETSNTYELGLRYASHRLEAKVIGYYGQYKNFIDGPVQTGTDDKGLALLQYVNRNKVTLKGIEAQAKYRFDQNWSVQTGFAYNKGENTTDGITSPLDSVNPMRMNLAIYWDNDTNTYGAQVLINHHTKKDKKDISADTPFIPKAFTTLDLNAYWKISKNFKLNVALNNVTDQKYWRWSDVRGQSATVNNNDAYTQPGRNFSIGLLGQF